MRSGSVGAMACLSTPERPLLGGAACTVCPPRAHCASAGVPAAPLFAYVGPASQAKAQCGTTVLHVTSNARRRACECCVTLPSFVLSSETHR